MTRSVITGVLGAAEGLPKRTDRAFAIDRTVEAVVIRAAAQLTGVSENQRDLVRRALVQAIEERWTKAQLRIRIERIIGLGSRYATAVDKFQQSMLNNGVAPSRARRMTNAYANRLARYQADVIARHEVRQAAAEGKRALWAQQQRDGQLSPDARRVWVLHPGEKHCGVCRAVRNKRTTVTGEYSNSLVGPPAHPNCMCWEVVVDNGVRRDTSKGM